MEVWKNFAKVHSRLEPPLRPSPGDVDNIRNAIHNHDERVLLLGVTPALTELGRQLIAIDKSQKVIDQVWQGDNERRKAYLGNWLTMPETAGNPTAVIGDGSLNAAGDGMLRVMQETRRVLRYDGIVALRTFLSPDTSEEVGDIRDDVLSGWRGNIHALKWRLCMSVAATRRDFVVAFAEVYPIFNEAFPDRSELHRRTGWSMQEIETIDSFNASDLIAAFPTRDMFLTMASEVFAKAEIIESQGYALSERCPITVLS
jgi:hypothetical protein